MFLNNGKQSTKALIPISEKLLFPNEGKIVTYLTSHMNNDDSLFLLSIKFDYFMNIHIFCYLNIVLLNLYAIVTLRVYLLSLHLK